MKYKIPTLMKWEMGQIKTPSAIYCKLHRLHAGSLHILLKGFNDDIMDDTNAWKTKNQRLFTFTFHIFGRILWSPNPWANMLVQYWQ